MKLSEAFMGSVLNRAEIWEGIVKLETALEQIAEGTYEDYGPYKAEEIARKALEQK